MLFTRSMDIQNTNKDICLKFCKSRFVGTITPPHPHIRLNSDYLNDEPDVLRLG